MASINLMVMMMMMMMMMMIMMMTMILLRTVVCISYVLNLLFIGTTSSVYPLSW